MQGCDTRADANARHRSASGRKRRGVRTWAAVTLVAMGISLAVWVDIRSRYDFWMTQFYRRGDGVLVQEAEPGKSALVYATRLRETTVGIRLALDDIDCFGGSNRGWSSWILRTTPRQDLVLPKLREIAASDPHDARRIEALGLLWDLTGDPAHARDLFRLAEAAGPPRTHHARARLQSMVDDEVVRAGLQVPASQPVSISEEQFLAALKQAARGTDPTESAAETP